MSIMPLIAGPDRPRRPSQRVLDYDTGQSTFSTPGRQAMRLDAPPCDPAGVAGTVQGLLIYQHVASQAFATSWLAEAFNLWTLHRNPVERLFYPFSTSARIRFSYFRTPRRCGSFQRSSAKSA
jgi:hypothetical protein